jgi:predicted 2-oxoglutarate/Fe(II)-dependent dioxygenase YbiX
VIVGGVAHEGLRAAGLFVEPGFLDPALCRAIRGELASADATRATIARGAREGVLDERTRRTGDVTLPAAVRGPVDARLAELRPRLEAAFGVALCAPEPGRFLVYRRGDFFRPHQDTGGDAGLPQYIRDRLISVVLFLCRQTRLPEPESYCGGALTFFCLPGPVDLRADVWGEEGLVVAFTADRLHEVRPVTHGLRATVVSWYPRPGDADPAR